MARHIRKLRLERGLTQEELAERLHVTRQAVSNWERSAAQPDLDTLQAIAAALGVEVTEVIYGAPPPAAVTGAVRRRWLITGALAVLGAAVLVYLVYLLAFSNGAAGTRRDGFRYQLGDGAYRTAVYTLTDTWSTEVNLDDPAASVGTFCTRMTRLLHCSLRAGKDRRPLGGHLPGGGRPEPPGRAAGVRLL